MHIVNEITYPSQCTKALCQQTYPGADQARGNTFSIQLTV